MRWTLRAFVLLSIPLLIFLLNVFGFFDHFAELNYTEFQYPLQIDVRRQLDLIKIGHEPLVAPINSFSDEWLLKNSSHCSGDNLVVLLVKSKANHFGARQSIRRTWGKLTDVACVQLNGSVYFRPYFLLGVPLYVDLKLLELINEEQAQFGDLLQQNFWDTYYNNTLKTLMGFRFAALHCHSAEFFLFVDDDYFVSLRNLAKLILLVKRDITLMEHLYMGYRFFSHVHRHRPSPFYISLKDYPYNKYPPYITAGAYLMSSQSVRDFYLASQFVKLIVFDDIFVGIVSKKLGVEPQHNPNFLFWEERFSAHRFRDIVAAHGFSDSNLLEQAFKISGDEHVFDLCKIC